MKEIPVLFENDSCLILNKPPGLSVQGGEGVKISLDSILSERYSSRPLLVHRLDRDTSGVILVAKTREAAAGFSALFAGAGAGKAKNGGPVIKQYLGVCSGVPKPPRGVLRQKLEVRGSEKKSETRYTLLSSADAGGFPCSLLELELGTGRTHQIRRHLASIKHPLLGDDKYGDFSLNKKLRKALGLKRLLLHAARLVIPPVPGLAERGIDVRAPVPEYFSPFAPRRA
ncbi:MAG: RluA family pseudouridine synthase [Treponema sp.]|nr:RluA family pseudouridine synthase [Treponema sp.]